MPDVVNGYQWELYNIAEDYSEYNDLAAKQPEKLKELTFDVGVDYPHAGGRQLQRAVPLYRNNQQVDLQSRAGAVERGRSKSRNRSIRQSQ